MPARYRSDFKLLDEALYGDTDDSSNRNLHPIFYDPDAMADVSRGLQELRESIWANPLLVEVRQDSPQRDPGIITGSFPLTEERLAAIGGETRIFRAPSPWSMSTSAYSEGLDRVVRRLEDKPLDAGLLTPIETRASMLIIIWAFIMASLAMEYTVCFYISVCLGLLLSAQGLDVNCAYKKFSMHPLASFFLAMLIYSFVDGWGETLAIILVHYPNLITALFTVSQLGVLYVAPGRKQVVFFWAVFFFALFLWAVSRDAPIRGVALLWFVMLLLTFERDAIPMEDDWLLSQ